MTFVICPNLAIDRVVRLPELVPGTTLRGDCLVQQAGGKGGNVARALAQLGGRGRLGGFAAGRTGRLIADLAGDEGLELELVLVAGESRVSTVFLEASGRKSDLFEHGPSVAAGDEQALVELAGGRPAAAGEWAAVTGSAPPGATPGFYARLVAALRDAGYRVLLDAEGEQLRHGLEARPEMAKVNLREALDAIGGDESQGDKCSGEGAGNAGAADSAAECVAVACGACAELIAAGAREAIVTMGSDGAVGCLAGGCYRITTPPVQAVNTVGSGDCFAAALMLAFERGEPVEAALRAAAGTAAANAASALTAHFDRDLAARLTAAAIVEPPQATL